MHEYAPPLAEIAAGHDLAGLDEILTLDAFAHLDRATVDGLLSEFGRLATDVIVPTDAVGDRVGARFDAATGSVCSPPGFAEAYRSLVDGGWNAAGVELAHGGGGAPALVSVALQEMLASANMALSLCPILSQSAVELLIGWASERQRRLFLPKLVSGEWTATMNLTEPDAGSDVGAVRTRAERDGDGRWLVTGTKVFITWGEHDLAPNIVHLVLARTPGAPPGTRGLSLFLVPKFLVADDGRLGERNAVQCLKIEDKLGIHASPTCVMAYEGAVGELVGEELAGMQGMFTMMNVARRAVGVQGLASAERALQQAERHAAERRQGRAHGSPAGPPSPIAEHPDVRRMLLVIRASVAGMRRLLYLAASCEDVARAHPDASRRDEARARLDLLTPIAKAWCSDVGVAAASLAVQVFGGMGYVEESGVPQRFRDSRIAPIYEGTNGIQAIDLVTRKVRRDGGHAMGLLLAEMDATLAALGTREDLAPCRPVLADAVSTLREATRWLTSRPEEQLADVLAGASTYLELCGLVVSGWLHVRAALAPDAPAATVRLCVFNATELLARAPGLLLPVTAGAGRLA